jgi:hypothetical protein
MTLGGNDLVIVDLANGSPIPPGDLAVDGGAHTNADFLEVRTPTASGDIAVTSSRVVIAGGNIPYADVERVSVNLLGSATLNRLQISAGRVNVVNTPTDQTLQVQQLNMQNPGILDLQDNDLLVKNGLYGDVFNLIRGARNVVPRWSGPGITTSSADTNQGLALHQVGADIAVKFTWNGDLNLDGRVNADDYFYIDQGFLQKPQPPKYHDGDFNFDGKINADDYFLIDQAFLNQKGQVLSAAKPAPLAATAAPTIKKAASGQSLFSKLKIRKSPRRAGH